MVRIFSPCKVNLFLKIIGKRSDGYHEILTIFQTITLGDYLTIIPGHCGLSLSCPPGLPTDRHNLVFRAAESFYQKTGIGPEVKIVLEKEVPIQAGLGGGSSNAAATLHGLNRLYNEPLPVGDLHELAAELGADVPFFLRGGTALGEGRGERITRLKDLPTFFVRVVMPPFGLSTARVFSQWDHNSIADWDRAEKALASLDLKELLANDLEKVAMKIRPELINLKDKLSADGADAVMLCGSGSSMFAVYWNKPQGRLSLPAGYRQWVASTLPRMEEVL